MKRVFYSLFHAVSALQINDELTQEGQALVCHVCKMTQDWTTGVECALKCMLRK